MSTPDARVLIFDLDDTLIKTSRLYYDVRDAVYDKMVSLGVDIADVEKQLEAIEVSNVKQFGFSKERFPLSLSHLYLSLCEKQGVRVDWKGRHDIESLGWNLYDTVHPMLPGALETIQELHGRFPLMLCTKGDVEIQQKKILNAQLRPYFGDVFIVPDKNVDTYREISTTLGVDPSQCFMIGDSIRSDINPSLAAGFNAVYIPCPDAWAYEVEPLQDGYVKLNSIAELLDIVQD
jgi:putative hydrolase of the HAD superfamily